MRIGIASKNATQAGIIAELLQPIVTEVVVYDDAAMDNGDFMQSNAHVMIIDYSVGSIMEKECVMEMISRDEPKVILTEK